MGMGMKPIPTPAIPSTRCPAGSEEQNGIRGPSGSMRSARSGRDLAQFFDRFDEIEGELNDRRCVCDARRA